MAVEEHVQEQTNVPVRQSHANVEGDGSTSGDWDGEENTPSYLEEFFKSLERPGSDITASNALPTDAAERMFQNANAIEPPYSFEALIRLFEHSAALRPNIDAYATNIDGFGHRFEPVIDFDASDADDRIAQAIYEYRLGKHTLSDRRQALYPTPEEIAAEKAAMVVAMRAEKRRLERFFANCCEDMSFISLRKALRQDYETLGNAYVEVLRNSLNEPAELVYLPGYSVRLLAADTQRTETVVKRKCSEFHYTTEVRQKRFRKYVQIIEGVIVYFKELGDPRIMSKTDGAYFDTVEELKEQRPYDAPATEILHMKLRSPRSVYGVPRWIGVLITVLGSRQAEEINASYFDNKTIPPGILLVSGGRLAHGTAQKLQSTLDNDVKGRRNFHKLLIAEAVGDGGALDAGGGSVKLEFKQLTDAQQKDGMFLQYDERNTDKIGMAFRQPRIVRGDVRDFNKATADAAMEQTEQQVYGPERTEEDFIWNRTILVEMGIRFWELKSNAPAMEDPQELATIIALLTEKGIITPGEARELSELVFSKELPNLDAAWTKQPIQLTLAGMVAEAQAQQPWTGDDIPLDTQRGAFGNIGMGAGITMTPTAQGAVITINEARAIHGLPPRTLADGTLDPDGNLTIAEYQEKVRSGARYGAPDAAQPPPAVPPRSPYNAPNALNATSYTLADLIRGDGVATGSRQAKNETIEQQAAKLIALRDVLNNARNVDARKRFMLAKREAMLSAGELDTEVLQKVFPVESLVELGIVEKAEVAPEE